LDNKRLLRAIEIAEAEQSGNIELPELPELRPLIIGIKWLRETTRKRITSRLTHRLEHGLIEEVEQLHSAGVSWETLNFYGLEYRLVAQYLQAQLNRNDMFQKLNSAIHQFAKKQETWLRRMQRNGHQIHWVEGTDDIVAQSMNIIKQHSIFVKGD